MTKICAIMSPGKQVKTLHKENSLKATIRNNRGLINIYSIVSSIKDSGGIQIADIIAGYALESPSLTKVDVKDVL